MTDNRNTKGDKMSSLIDRLNNFAGDGTRPINEACAEAIGEIERLRGAITTVLDTFETDEAQGYRSRDRQYAISILRMAIPRS